MTSFCESKNKNKNENTNRNKNKNKSKNENKNKNKSKKENENKNENKSGLVGVFEACQTQIHWPFGGLHYRLRNIQGKGFVCLFVCLLV